MAMNEHNVVCANVNYIATDVMPKSTVRVFCDRRIGAATRHRGGTALPGDSCAQLRAEVDAGRRSPSNLRDDPRAQLRAEVDAGIRALRGDPRTQLVKV
eukprot:9166310-Heterocapsa_arctica.AAC.1